MVQQRKNIAVIRKQNAKKNPKNQNPNTPNKQTKQKNQLNQTTKQKYFLL